MGFDKDLESLGSSQRILKCWSFVYHFFSSFLSSFSVSELLWVGYKIQKQLNLNTIPPPHQSHLLKWKFIIRPYSLISVPSRWFLGLISLEGFWSIPTILISHERINFLPAKQFSPIHSILTNLWNYISFYRWEMDLSSHRSLPVALNY